MHGRAKSTRSPKSNEVSQMYVEDFGETVKEDEAELQLPEYPVSTPPDLYLPTSRVVRPQKDEQKPAFAQTRGRRIVFHYLKLIDGTMPEWSSFIEKYWYVDFVDYNLRGAAQVVFMNNPISGAFIVAALFLASWWTAVCGMVGLICGTSFALFLGVNIGAIRAGLHGYNGILVGLALATFMDGTKFWPPLVASAICGAFSTVLTVAIGNFFGPKYGVPAFTLPFNFITIFFLLATYNFSYFPLASPSPSIVVPLDNKFSFNVVNVVKAVFTGIGQVYLAGSPYSGALMLAGTIVCSRISAIFMLLGSIIGILTAFLMGVSVSEIEFGLWSYNAVLGTMAVGGIFYVINVRSAVLAIFCGILCTLILGTTKTLFIVWGVPSLTFPFCTGAILFLLMRGSIAAANEVLDLASITTAEGNLAEARRKRRVAPV
eukprot:TRINITY_DN7859_c0_g1_i1.p1 TRINITY_DN7859_c0_g1~~TRINITY_DN7859_c0_g1_i1.p1  ORF type:complete len:431 (+),score=54.75 TRINITY_DN7859_c0_g1_i1:76-1368(+)